ncbi:MAG: Crp/Fnr family transcriptional regulator [Oscillospiraceae bacterium]|nr:Crp/Fnr family transcriptional regulator [Oscillospiraceae bacterium]
MKEHLSILQKCPLFTGVDPKDIPVMMTCLGGTIRSFSKKETIIAEGDPAETVGILLSGRAQIIRIDYFGSRSILAEMGPSDMFGESYACAGMEQMPVAVVATEDCTALLTDCFRITHACSNACIFHQQMIYNLLRVVAEKNIGFHEKLEVISGRTTRDKLLSYLALQAKKQDSVSFEIPFDRQELADYLEVDRSGLSAEISKLRKEGILESEKNRFTLLAGCSLTDIY